MAELPFFPMAIDAYLADTRHLSDAEHGRYHLILYELWRAPKQRLPNEDAWLARRLCRSIERIIEEIRPLIKEFCDCDGNWITQKRLSKEFLRARKVTKQRSDAAKALWKKKKQTSERIREDTQLRIGSADEPTPTLRPTPTPIIKDPVAKATGERGRTDDKFKLPGDWQPSTACRDYACDKGLDPANVTESFVDYFTNGRGKREQRTGAAWEKRFRIWCNTDAERKPRGAGGVRPAAPGGDAGAFARAADRLGRS